MTQLIIIRHGNTFSPGETPRRVGGRTDLPLVESGMAQAAALGQHFKARGIIPDVVYASSLQRTQQTAEGILQGIGVVLPLQISDIFDEIDYGPDENMTEEHVIARIGREAIKLWDDKGIVPQGWRFKPEEAKKNWFNFAQSILDEYSGQTIMVVTSNGTARFAPSITRDYDGFIVSHDIKLKTGSYGVLFNEDGSWKVRVWGVHP